MIFQMSLSSCAARVSRVQDYPLAVRRGADGKEVPVAPNPQRPLERGHLQVRQAQSEADNVSVRVDLVRWISTRICHAGVPRACGCAEGPRRDQALRHAGGSGAAREVRRADVVPGVRPNGCARSDGVQWRRSQARLCGAKVRAAGVGAAVVGPGAVAMGKRRGERMGVVWCAIGFAGTLRCTTIP